MLSAALVGGPLAVDAVSPAPAAAEAEASRRAVDEYLEMESRGQTGSVKELQAIRSKYRFRRTADGRVELRSSRGDWWSVRLDMEVPGAMLLRDPSGKVFAVQTDTVQQIDLSEDLICLMMFADGNWEAQMAPIEYADGGKIKQLKLDEKEFREVIGILNEAGEALSEAGNA
uniref:Uncharacterized protein n=1 Tax=Chlamydomonas euryale TaxID=1486919 RepID=A0A7R9V095_9CHLO